MNAYLQNLYVRMVQNPVCTNSFFAKGGWLPPTRRVLSKTWRGSPPSVGVLHAPRARLGVWELPETWMDHHLSGEMIGNLGGLKA